MSTKRERSPSLTDDAPPAKRGNNETGEPPQLHVPFPEDAAALATAAHTVSISTESSVPMAPPITGEPQEATHNEVINVPTDVLSAAMQHQQQSGNVSVTAPSMGLMVVAPEFEVVHDSWEAFEEALKAYGKLTYQLYVIRSTTSVKRRNLKIAESAGRGDSSNLTALRRAGLDMAVSEDPDHVVERTLIPEQYQWYSKSLKCTHGWKDRHRGTGKRGSGVVRSTSCPAKMCVTLQHRGPGPEDWKVVVTKHVRTHNHQLSKELYLYYTENRRIYDPELLAVAVGGDSSGATKPIDLTSTHLTSLIDQAYQRSGLYRMLTSSDDQSQQASSMAFIAADPSSAALSRTTTNSNTDKHLVALSDASNGNFAIRPRNSATPLAPMPPLGAMVLTPGTIPSRAMDGGGFCVPRVSTKVHASWDAFHDYIAQYAFDTAQVFRTRSTVSIAARNAKIVTAIAAKTGGEDHDVASYASYAVASPSSRLIPEEFKWFSKLLICTYGWKRRTRGKTPRLEHDDGPCSAMLLARMERNVDGNWQVVINRQVPEHNHRLGGHEEIGTSNHGIIEGPGDTGALPAAPSFESTPIQSASVDGSSLMETQTITTVAGKVEEPSTSPSSQREIVVRVPKLQSMFKSWDDFHASLKAYSDATYQLYRTRTTSSAKGRNKKIAQMKRRGEEEENEDYADNADDDDDVDTTLTGMSAARKIPESWRWYSKTLTCTHGWKERHRGTGKRNAHGVRSTACPVKICATVQYLNPSPKLMSGTLSVENNDATSESYWRVVVTKHIVDHNHNLSRELYQHYCENRRIYDPELLAIDTSNSNTVITRKTGPSSSDQVATNLPDTSQMLSQSPALSTQLEAGLAEAVSHAQLFGSTGNYPVSMSTSGVAAMPQTSTSGTGVQQSVPSVVLLPYSTTPSHLPNQTQCQLQQMQQEQQNQAAFAAATTAAQPQTSEGAATLAAVATPGLSPANLVLLNNVGMSMNGFPPPGSIVISVACRVHGSSSGGTTSSNNASTSANTPANQCTCFRIAGGGNYVTIVPANEPLAHADTSFDADDEAMLYAEEMEGAWQPSANVEIEKVSTDSGDLIWRVPRIVRRYPTWEAFHKYLDVYSAATFQLYRVRTTYSVRSRNTRLRQLAASRGLTVREDGYAEETEQEGANGMSRAHLVPEQYDWYSKTFLCTHGWKRRSRGSGQRVSHSVRATECPAKVCATLQRVDNSSNWSVVVTKHLAEHNHELSEALYQQYSEVRRVRDPEVLAQAEQLWRGGATRRRVFEFLKERSPNQTILMKDVHNLVQRWQALERRQQGDNAQLQDEQPRQNSPIAAQDDENSSWL